LKKLESKRKRRREEKIVKCVVNSLTIVEKTTQRLVESVQEQLSI
jgi:hypothetical protein